MADRPIQGRREHSLGQVVPINRNRPTPAMYDRTSEPLDQTVVLPRVVARHIAGLLIQAAPHLPSRRAVDEAVQLLTGQPTAKDRP